jgi:hypothetical protein
MSGTTYTPGACSGIPAASSGRAGRSPAAAAGGVRTGRPAWWLAAAAVTAATAAGVLAGCSSAAAPSSSAAAAPAAPSASAAAAASASPVATASSDPAGPPTSCNVITQAEAGAALGQTVNPPIKGKATVEGGVACVFNGPDVPPGASPDIPYGDTVRVVLVTGDQAKQYFDDYKSKVNATSISGLGDEAFYDGYASISVLKGDEYLRIAVGIANNLPAEKTLAADALTRM